MTKTEIRFSSFVIFCGAEGFNLDLPNLIRDAFGRLCYRATGYIYYDLPFAETPGNAPGRSIPLKTDLALAD